MGSLCCVQYSDETASLLARELLDGATADMTVAVVSAPSVFVALKNILVRLFLLPRVERGNSANLHAV
jgi:hypothetical protein